MFTARHIQQEARLLQGRQGAVHPVRAEREAEREAGRRRRRRVAGPRRHGRLRLGDLRRGGHRQRLPPGSC